MDTPTFNTAVSWVSERLFESSVEGLVVAGILVIVVVRQLFKVVQLYERLKTLQGTSDETNQQVGTGDEEEKPMYSPGRQRELETQLSRLQPALAMGRTQEVKLRSKVAKAVALERQQRSLNRDILARGDELAEDCDEEIEKAQAVMQTLHQEREEAVSRTMDLEEYAAELQERLDRQHTFHAQAATSIKDDAEITEAVVRDCLESNHDEALMLLKLRDELVMSNQYLQEQATDLAEESANLQELILEEEVATLASKKRLEDEGIRCLESTEEVQAVQSLLDENTADSLNRAINILTNVEGSPHRALPPASSTATTATATPAETEDEMEEQEVVVVEEPVQFVPAALVNTPAAASPLKVQSINTTPVSAKRQPQTPASVGAQVLDV